MAHGDERSRKNISSNNSLLIIRPHRFNIILDHPLGASWDLIGGWHELWD